METFAFGTTEEALLVITGLLFFIQAGYYCCLYNRIYRHNRSIQKRELQYSDELQPLSVIVYALEESDSLRHTLKLVLEQDYPQFEVIVINDSHGSGNENDLAQLEKQYPNLYHSFIPDSSRYISHKKLAITLGIKASKYDWLVLTDAGCFPQSNQWLRQLARNFTPDTRIVLGYSGYEYRQGWVSKRIVFDNLFNSMRYLGFALAGSPYMGIGRNMAYKKDLFYEQKGFSAHLNLLRGDDDLFVNQAATAKNTKVEAESQAAVRRQLPRPKAWREEKTGYASTAHFYHGAQRWLAGFETTSRLLFYLGWMGTAVWGGLNAHWVATGVTTLLFLVRWAMQASIVNRTADALGEKQHYYFTLPLFDWWQPLQSLRWKMKCMLRDKSDFLRK